MNTGIIILAAGGSSRMTVPKQGLKYNGTTLLKHAVNTARNSGCKPIIVVSGAVELKLDHDTECIIQNSKWQEGIASSIIVGLQEIQKDESVNSVMIMLCDQPLTTSEFLRNLAREKANSDSLIIASSYNGISGTPAIFDKELFPELLLLSGDEGGRHIISRYKNRVISIPLPGGGMDIDTLEDYQRLVGDPYFREGDQ